jgi:hypothetical protein
MFEQPLQPGLLKTSRLIANRMPYLRALVRAEWLFPFAPLGSRPVGTLVEDVK